MDDAAASQDDPEREAALEELSAALDEAGATIGHLHRPGATEPLSAKEIRAIARAIRQPSSPPEEEEPDVPAASFFRGAWLNRRYTTLRASLVITVVMWVGLITAVMLSAFLGNSTATVTTRTVGILVLVVLLTLSAVLYPAAREGYYRVTAPARPALTAFFTHRPFSLFYLPARLLIFLALWLLAIPLGLVASVCLGVAEIRGRGWRLPPPLSE